MLLPILWKIWFEWSDPPSALQILQVLDFSVHDALATGTIIIVLERLFEEALIRENVTRENVVSQATWRKS